MTPLPPGGGGVGRHLSIQQIALKLIAADLRRKSIWASG
jgi:hypothetical protein